MKLFIVMILGAILGSAQDKITLSVTQGTQTRTTEISGTVITDALKALNANVQAGNGTEPVDALRKLIIAQMLMILENVAGTTIQQTATSLQTANAAHQTAIKAFTTAAEAKPIQ